MPGEVMVQVSLEKLEDYITAQAMIGDICAVLRSCKYETDAVKVIREIVGEDFEDGADIQGENNG